MTNFDHSNPEFLAFISRENRRSLRERGKLPLYDDLVQRFSAQRPASLRGLKKILLSPEREDGQQKPRLRLVSSR